MLVVSEIRDAGVALSFVEPDGVRLAFAGLEDQPLPSTLAGGRFERTKDLRRDARAAPLRHDVHPFDFAMPVVDEAKTAARYGIVVVERDEEYGNVTGSWRGAGLRVRRLITDGQFVALGCSQRFASRIVPAEFADVRHEVSRSTSSRYRAAVASTISVGSSGGVPSPSQFVFIQFRTICLSKLAVRSPPA